MTLYSTDFYSSRHTRTEAAADTILSLVLESIPPPSSAIDIGCGVGTWLSALARRGVSDIQGVDGPWVDERLLVIPKERFLRADLSQPLPLDRTYSLAISLEVAEHLPASRSAAFVDTLTRLSDFVLFSAAIPFQGGSGHINEQWPQYWVDLFARKDYACLDRIRSRIWNESTIPVWYRQNALLFMRRARLGEVTDPNDSVRTPLALVHPEAYLTKIAPTQTLRGAWDLMAQAIKNSVKEKLGVRR